MVISFEESFFEVYNYWSFCTVPGLDTSTLALIRVVVCFVCTILAIPLTHKKPLGMFIGAAWIFAAAAVCEAGAEVVSAAVWINTDPGRLPFYAVGWTPQSVAYYTLIDLGAVLGAMLMCMILGHLPMHTFVPYSVRDLVNTRAVTAAGAKKHRAMLSGRDTWLYMFLVPFLFAVLETWAAVALVKWSAKPAWSFRAPAFVVTITSTVGVAILWSAVNRYAVEYVALINFAAVESTERIADATSRANRRAAAMANAGTRVSMIWGFTMATVLFTGLLCLGKWLPGEYGLAFQPLVCLAIVLVLAIVIRLLLGIGRIAATAETSYATPNFITGMGRHLMTNSRISGLDDVI